MTTFPDSWRLMMKAHMPAVTRIYREALETIEENPSDADSIAEVALARADEIIRKEQP
jgi:hypothetical protein